MLRRAFIAAAAVWLCLSLAHAQTPNQNLLRMNGGIHPAVYTNFTAINSTLPSSLYTYSGASLRTITDATGAITSAPNCLILNNATLSTQGVTVGPQWNYLLSFYGTGSVTLSGAATGTLNGTGANNQVSLKVTAPTAGTLTLTVSGSVTKAILAAVTYETTPRPGDQVVTTSAAYYGPAFDYNPVTLAALGLRIEESRTNLFLNSGSPATQTITVASGSAYSISFYGTGVLTLSGALTQVMTGSAYPTRTTYTGTTSTTSLVVTVTTLATMSYPQVELGGFATSAIPSGASTITRAADGVGIVGLAQTILKLNNGALIVEAAYNVGVSNGTAIGNSSTSNVLGLNSSYNARAGVLFTGDAVTTNATSLGTPTRIGINWNTTAVPALTMAGGPIAVGTNAFFATSGTPQIGNRGGGYYMNGHITKLALYNVALPAAVLQHNVILTTRLN